MLRLPEVTLEHRLILVENFFMELKQRVASQWVWNSPVQSSPNLIITLSFTAWAPTRGTSTAGSTPLFPSP